MRQLQWVEERLFWKSSAQCIRDVLASLPSRQQLQAGLGSKLMPGWSTSRTLFVLLTFAPNVWVMEWAHVCDEEDWLR